MDKITISHAESARTTNDGFEFTVFSLEDVSDGYHTIAELYDHRNTLYIALCRAQSYIENEFGCARFVWRSKLHSDGSSMEGWFILGIGKEKGKQVTYHLPNSRWDDTSFAETLEKAPEWDGHTSQDVLKRLPGI